MSLETATALSAAYAAGTLSPVEATEASLAAVDRWNGEVNAVLFTDPEGALASARAAEERWRRGRPLGPADGVPVTVKDMFLTKGWPTPPGRGTRTPRRWRGCGNRVPWCSARPRRRSSPGRA